MLIILSFMLRFRCLRHRLVRDKGKTEIFVENLAGGPDNICLAPDGSFWIALLQDLLTFGAIPADIFALVFANGEKDMGV
ncbi:hypothetical protein ACFX2C_018086 [Malus domestica]